MIDPVATSSTAEWIRRQEEMMSDVLIECIADGGPGRARDVIRAAIASWIEYHQQELSKWNSLAATLQMEQ